MRRCFAAWFVVLVTMLGGGRASLLASEAAPAWQLRTSIQCGLAGIYPEELFVNPPVALPHVRLFESAIGFGQTLSLTRAQVIDLLRENAPALVASTWVGPTQIKISRRAHSCNEAELKTLLTEALQREHVKERGELELRLTRPWVSASIPDDPVKLKILELPAASVTPNFIVRFEISDGRDVIGTWQVPVQARIWREVIVAGSALRRGQSVKDADLQRERRDVLTLRDAVVSIDADSTAFEIAENIPAGAPLTSRSIRLKPVVRRGKLADAVVLEGPLMISVKVEVLEDGVPGQFVRVRNVKSRREFRGKVENEETILVPL